MKHRLFMGDPAVVGNPTTHYLRFAIYLYIFWLLITGSMQPKFLIMGAIASLIVAWVCTPLFMIDNLSHTKKYFLLAVPLFPLIGYLFWLLKELLLANLDVIQAVWKKQLPIEPKLLHFQVAFDNPAALAMLANSITLTPGTITLSVSKDNIFEIHALTPGAAEGICSGAMAQKVGHLFRQDISFTMLETPCSDCPVCQKQKEESTCGSCI